MTELLIALAVLAVVAVAVVLLLRSRKASRARSESLRRQFGPEYDREVARAGRPKDAEAVLADRREQYERLDVRPLDPDRREGYREDWAVVQAHFVDAPGEALARADDLVHELMRERGLLANEGTTTDEAMLSVEHAHVLESFRAGHAGHRLADEGRADTEDVRQAMLHFRVVLEELLDDDRGGLVASPDDAPVSATPVRDGTTGRP